MNKLPNEKNLYVKGLLESEYNILLIYRILVSVNPQNIASIIWNNDEKIAITADYAGGVERLAEFFKRLSKNAKDKKASEKIIKFLTDKANVARNL